MNNIINNLNEIKDISKKTERLLNNLQSLNTNPVAKGLIQDSINNLKYIGDLTWAIQVILRVGLPTGDYEHE